MSNCKIFGKTFYDTVRSYEDFSLDLSWLKTLIPPYADSTSGTWMPIYIRTFDDRVLPSDAFGSLLSNPQNIDDATSPPCNCDSSRSARNVSNAFINGGIITDEPEDGQLCTYCENLNANSDMQCVATIDYRPRTQGTKTTFGWPITRPILDPPGGNSTVYSIDC